MLREKLGPKQSFGGAGLVTGQGWLAIINPRAFSVSSIQNGAILNLKKAQKALGTKIINLTNFVLRASSAFKMAGRA